MITFFHKTVLFYPCSEESQVLSILGFFNDSKVFRISVCSLGIYLCCRVKHHKSLFVTKNMPYVSYYYFVMSVPLSVTLFMQLKFPRRCMKIALGEMVGKSVSYTCCEVTQLSRRRCFCAS